MASSTKRRRQLVKGVLWILGGFLVVRLLFSGKSGVPERISESAGATRSVLESSNTPVAIESGGQWLVAMVQTVIGWIGSLLSVALVFALIAVAVMVITDWGGKKA